MKLVNTFLDLVTPGHTWSHVTIIALLYYCTCIVTTAAAVLRYRLDEDIKLVKSGHTWSQSGFIYETFLGWGVALQELQKSTHRVQFLLV